MTQPYHLVRNSGLLLPSALALALAACTDPTANETATDTEGTGTSGDTDTSGTTPGTMTMTPTTTETPTTTDTPTTTEMPTTTDPTTDTPDTTDTTVSMTTDTSSTTAVDTDTGSTTVEDTDTGVGPVELASVWVTANPGGLQNDRIVGLNPALDLEGAALALIGDVVSIQSVAVTGSGDGVVTFDAPGGVGGVMVVGGIANNPANGAIGLGNRVISGPATGLIAPKGLEVDGPDGLFFVADTGAGDIKAYPFNGAGDLEPSFIISDLGSSAAVWDIHYVSGADTLYAAGTNGDVQVYEDFSTTMGQAGPDRTITPAENGVAISINLHGITVDNNRLFLSDVGDAADPADGQLFIINNANNADGLENVAQRIQGDQLGNPVDLELRSGLSTVLYVAEKSNDVLVTYNRDLITNLYELGETLAVTKPESVALAAGTRLVVASNPAGLANDTALVINDPVLGDLTVLATRDQLGSVTSVQSLVVASSGDAYVSFDGPAVSGGGGVFVVPGLSALEGEGQVSAVSARIWGPKTGIVAPKGMTLNAAQDRLFIADLGAGDIKVFSVGELGDVAPLYTISDIGGPVWDVDYDDASGLLFAAGVNGTVRVFEGVGADAGPESFARIITPTDGRGQVIGVNLHGIHYDAVTNALLLTDVGDPASPSDGWIFVIAGADSVEGEVSVETAIGGDGTKLGNPVDLAFDGVNLYVAEKANSAVLRYDAILQNQGFNNLAEDAFFAVQNAESVQLFFAAP